MWVTVFFGLWLDLLRMCIPVEGQLEQLTSPWPQFNKMATNLVNCTQYQTKKLNNSLATKKTKRDVHWIKMQSLKLGQNNKPLSKRKMLQIQIQKNKNKSWLK